MDNLFWLCLTPNEMHKHPPKSYEETFKTCVPFIHRYIYELCERNKVPVIKLFNEDYSLVIEAIEGGIAESQKGYFVPVNGV
jgi:hypothetical protein